MTITVQYGVYALSQGGIPPYSHERDGITCQYSMVIAGCQGFANHTVNVTYYSLQIGYNKDVITISCI